MDPHAFYDSIFFADVRRAVRRHIIKTVWTTILTEALFFLIFFYVYYFFVLINMQWIYWLIFAALTALLFYIKIRPGLKKRDKIIRQFCAISNDELIAVEKKYDKASPEFMTLFLLDEYIYFPDEMLLIPYEEIEEAKADFPYIKFKHFIRINTGAFLKLKCSDGKKYSLKIRESQEYREYHDKFLSQLDKRREEHRQKVNDLKYASGSTVRKITSDRTPKEAITKLCEAAFRHCALKVLVYNIVILLGAYLFLNGIVIEFGEVFHKAFWAVSLSADVIVMIVLIFRFSARREEMLICTEKFSPEDVETIMKGRVFFGELFILDDCLWFVRQNAAVDYDDIDSIEPVYDSYNFFRILNNLHLNFCLKNKKAYKVRIKSVPEYKERYQSFIDELRKKPTKITFRR